MRICYYDSLEAVQAGYVPMIVPAEEEEGVVFFTIRPGTMFFEADEEKRMRAHIYMAIEAHKKMDAEEDFPNVEDQEEDDAE